VRRLTPTGRPFFVSGGTPSFYPGELDAPGAQGIASRLDTRVHRHPAALDHDLEPDRYPTSGRSGLEDLATQRGDQLAEPSLRLVIRQAREARGATREPVHYFASARERAFCRHTVKAEKPSGQIALLATCRGPL
jgi:hypothetical protein